MPRRTNKNADPFASVQSAADNKAVELGVELEPEKFTKEWYAADWITRKKIFIEREIKIRNAFDKNKLVPFILNDAQNELLEASNDASIDNSIENFTLKCRRLGISTYYAADYLADGVIEDGHHVRIVAQDPKTVSALMKVVKTMYENLSPEIKPNSKYNSKYELAFDNDTRFSISSVVPGHEEQGRGDTFTRLHLTEIPFWKGDAETAATALEDATKGGKISGESTAKGVGDWFHRKYTKGKIGEGGIRSHFFEWWWNTNYQIKNARIEFFAEKPILLVGDQTLETVSVEDLEKAYLTNYSKETRREENLPMQSEVACAMEIAKHLAKVGITSDEFDWMSEDVARRLAWRRQEIAKKGEKKFRVEYPENDVDPFTQTGGTVFDQSYAQVVVDPREPEAGHQYLVILDPSIGIEGGDPASIVVIDRGTLEQVYSWRGWEKQDQQARRVCDLSDKYFASEIVIENNMGEAAIIECENLGYGHRLYKYVDVQTQRDVENGKVSMSNAMERARPGLPMTEKIKRTAIATLERLWRTAEFKACSQNLCDEATVFVQNGNKLEAKAGFHDDEIMSVAIGVFIIETDYVGKPGHKSSGQKRGSAQMGGF